MTQCEDVMRAALEQLALSPELGAIAREALAEVDALPENDTDDLRPALEQMRKAAEAAYVTGERWKACAKAAEARLAQIAELVADALPGEYAGKVYVDADHYRSIQRLARGEEPA